MLFDEPTSALDTKLGEQVAAVEKVAAQYGVDRLHVDVMDGHFVPNLTIGPLVCASLRPRTRLPIDVHLMVKPVDRIVPEFAKAGASIISFHPEASEHVDRTIALIKESGCRAGLVLNPATPLGCLDHTLEKLDLVLLMSVNPGFGGQKFIYNTILKIRQLREMAIVKNLSTLIEVDGGVGLQNAEEILKAGANVLVAGSSVFGAADPVGTIAKLKAIRKGEVWV